PRSRAQRSKARWRPPALDSCVPRITRFQYHERDRKKFAAPHSAPRRLRRSARPRSCEGTRTMRSLGLTMVLLVGGCATQALVPLLDNSVPVTNVPHDSVPLEVITRKNNSVVDPLPVQNGGIAFGDVEASLGHAVSSATVPWA